MMTDGLRYHAPEPIRDEREIGDSMTKWDSLSRTAAIAAVGLYADPTNPYTADLTHQDTES